MTNAMRKEDRELARKLAPEAVEPPEDLLARLKADIPEELPAFTRRPRHDDDVAADGARDGEGEGGRGRVLRFPAVFGMSGPTLLKAAATVVLAVGAGWIALQVQRQVPDRQAEEALQDATASRAPAPSRSEPTRGEPAPEELQALGYVQEKNRRVAADESAANEPVDSMVAQERAPGGGVAPDAGGSGRRSLSAAELEAKKQELQEQVQRLHRVAPGRSAQPSNVEVEEPPAPPAVPSAPPAAAKVAPPPPPRPAPESVPQAEAEAPIWVSGETELTFREGSAEEAAPRLRKKLDVVRDEAGNEVVDEKRNELADRDLPETDVVFSLPRSPSQPRSAEPAPTVAARRLPAPPVRDLEIEVRHEEGQPLPGAVLRLRDSQGNEVQAVADPRGRAYFYDIAPGEYRVQAALEGFATVARRVEPPETERRELKVDLPLATLQEEIVVVAERPGEPQASFSAASIDPDTSLVVQPGTDVGEAFGRRQDRPPVPENPLVDTAYDSLSTFGLDVDTGTYGLVRAHLTQGQWPEPSTVRVEELLNAFDYGDPPPAQGDFAITAQGAPSPFRPGLQLLRLGLKARVVTAENRKPAALTFVVDVSGSMQEPSKLELAKQALGLLLDQLEPGDTVALVAYGDDARTVLPHTADKEAVRQALDGLGDGGSTNAEAGLRQGYEEARRAFRPGAVNRIVLCSDGVANVGVTDPEEMLEVVGREARRGIELTTLGFGMGEYNDRLMEQLADRGDGRYAYLDDLVEAHRVLVEELTGTVQTIARDARVQFELNPGAVRRYRLLGYENRDIEDHRFRFDDQDAGEVGSGHSVTVLYELELEPAVPDTTPLGILRLRWWSVEQDQFLEMEHPVYRRDLANSWDRSAPALRWSAVTARFAQVLRGQVVAGELPGLAQRMQSLAGQAYPADARRSEMASLVHQAAEIHRLQQGFQQEP